MKSLTSVAILLIAALAADWDYDNMGSDWTNYDTCMQGTSQSPIDIPFDTDIDSTNKASLVESESVAFEDDYEDVEDTEVYDNGHSV